MSKVRDRSIITKAATDQYRQGWDTIFGKKPGRVIESYNGLTHATLPNESLRIETDAGYAEGREAYYRDAGALIPGDLTVPETGKH